MYCISVNHKISDTFIREKYALNESEQKNFYKKVRESVNISGCVCLMTCNRNEIYFEGNEVSVNEIENIYKEIKNINIKNLREHSMRYENKLAIKHLYKVICGLDSAVLGEVEIIRQVKQAYLMAQKEKVTDANLNLIFQGAMQVAKEIADKSKMTRLPVSVGTLTTAAVLDFCKEYENPQILLVGATGAIGTIVLKDITDANKNAKIIATSRKHGEDYFEYKNTNQVKWIHYDNRYEYLENADVVISATNSPHYTFLSEKVEKVCDYKNKQTLFIDLAVPRDVDEDINKIKGCQVKNIDYIKTLAKENNEKKLTEAKKTMLIIEEKVRDIEKQILFRKFMENNKQIIENLENKSATWLLYKLKNSLENEALEQVLDLIGEEKTK